MVQTFRYIDRSTLKRKLQNQEAVLVEVPAKYTRQNVDERIRAIEVDGEIVPYLACKLCKATFIWFKFQQDTKSWVNQSGLKSIKNHLSCCPKLESVGIQSKDMKKIIQAQGALTKRTSLGITKSSSWKNFVVDLLSHNATVSISAHARIVSEVGNFVASVTHSEGSLFDFSIDRTQLTDHLVQRGRESQGKLEAIFNVATQRHDFGISGIVDHWSARHTHLITPYGALIVCGLDDTFEWFRFPLKLECLENQKIDSQYTFDLVSNCLVGLNCRFKNPFFICSDNEAKIIAACDGRYDIGGIQLVGRVGCVEYALSTCINDVYDADAQKEMKLFLEQISKIETFYNKRPGLAKGLPCSIPEKSTMRPWRSYFHRFDATVRNYSHYQLSGEYELVDILPPLDLCKSQLEIMKDAKYAFDKFEVNGPTAHLSFLSYLILDIKLYRKETGIDEIFGFSNKTAGHLRETMGNKVWPYSGSSFSKTAAFFTGIDFYSKIMKLISSVENDAILLDLNISMFKQGWLHEARSIDSVAESEIKLLINTLTSEPDKSSSCSDSASHIRKIHSTNDLFDSLFDSNAASVSGGDMTSTIINSEISSEIERFKARRYPTADVQYFWKNTDYFLLRRAAQIFLSVPASSAAVEHVFSEAGIILSKQRRHLDAGKLAALLYIKYATKYSHLCSRFETSQTTALGSMCAQGEFDFDILEENEDD